MSSRSTFADWLSSPGGAHARETLSRYQWGEYWINEHLRSEGGSRGSAGEEPSCHESIAALDEAFRHADGFSGVVYRGIPRSAARTVPELAGRTSRARVWERRGVSLVDRGYLSTSLRREVAEGFGRHGAVLEIRVPEPVPAIRFDALGKDFEDPFGLAGEAEMLFPRGSVLDIGSGLSHRRLVATLRHPRAASEARRPRA